MVSYGLHLEPEVLKRRVLGALERRVLTQQNPELRAYFERVIEACTSPYSGNGEDDGVTAASDDDLEQAALLLCHHDVDGDGVLGPDEFTSLIELTISQTGEAVAADQLAQLFSQADVDESNFIDLNELLLLRRAQL